MIPVFRVLKVFPKVPDTVQRALAQLEDNIRDWTEVVRRDAKTHWDVYGVTLDDVIAPSTDRYQASVNQLLVISTSNGNVHIDLPNPTLANRGQAIAVVDTAGSAVNSLKVFTGAGASQTWTITGSVIRQNGMLQFISAGPDVGWIEAL